MGQSHKASRQPARTRRQSRRRRWLAFFVAVPVLLVAIVAVVVLTRQPGYSGFEVIGKQPTVVQVFLPG